jgi:hypothetical protein
MSVAWTSDYWIVKTLKLCYRKFPKVGPIWLLGGP